MQFLLGEVDSMGILLYPQRMMKDGAQEMEILASAGR